MLRVPLKSAQDAIERAGQHECLQTSAGSAGRLRCVLVRGSCVLTLAIVLAAATARAEELLVLRRRDVVDHLFLKRSDLASRQTSEREKKDEIMRIASLREMPQANIGSKTIKIEFDPSLPVTTSGSSTSALRLVSPHGIPCQICSGGVDNILDLVGWRCLLCTLVNCQDGLVVL